MFSIQFCICFYAMLYVCLCNNFTAKIIVQKECTEHPDSKKEMIQYYIGIGRNIKNKNYTDTHTDVVKEQSMELTKKNITEKAVDKDQSIKKTKENITQNDVDKDQSLKSKRKDTTENYVLKEKSIKLKKKYVVEKDNSIQLKNNNMSRSNYAHYNGNKRSSHKKFVRINYVQNITANDNFNKTQHILPKNNDITVNYQNNTGEYFITQKNIFRENNNVFDIGQNIIPEIQKRLNNKGVMKSLDEFKMVRRKTHFTMPDIKYNNEIPQHDTDYYQDIIRPDIPKYYKKYNKEYKNKMSGARTDFESDYYTNKLNDGNLPSSHIYPTYDEEIKIINLLRKQTHIIGKLAKNIQNQGKKKKKKNTDFDSLLSEVQAKQELYKKSPNYTAFTFETTTVPTTTTTKATTTKKPTTIITLFDETEVRNALKNDPHVKRILKMANRKREKYLMNARKYYNSYNQYT